MSKIHLGTSSWQFDAWREVFYPQEIASDQWLAYYASHFATVEVNTSFYGLPKPATVVKWVQNVPAGFTFCLKAPRAISHEKRLVGCQEETLQYLEVLRSLGSAAAPGFVQLPPSLTRQNAGRALANYLDWLAQQIAGLRIAIEVRSADLMTPAFARFVAEHKIAFVLVDRIATTDLFDTWWELVTTGSAPAFALIRWIGDDENGPKGDREISARRDEQLAQWAARMIQLTERNVEVFGYMHNPYEGHSPASLRRLLALLAGQGVHSAWSPSAVKGKTEQLSLL